MGEILGLGVTHFPGLTVPDEQMNGVLLRTLGSDRFPAALRDPARWPEPMRKEWGSDKGATSAAEHRRRQVEAFRAVRKELERFTPDFVVIFGDDQYENFREDMIPSFCIFAAPDLSSRPFARKGVFTNQNVWSAGPETTIPVAGHPEGAKYLIAKLMDAGIDMTYAYTLRHDIGLAHAFINTVMYLDWDRQGFPWPVVPFHVNCYGSSIVSKRGGIGHLKGEAGVPDPPGPSPARCFDIGAATARILAQSPYRVALIASSSWSHAFLTEKNQFLHCDIDSDRARFEELRNGRLDEWRTLTTAQIEDAGQQELLNWLCLAGAMHELGRKAEVVDWIETYIFNSSKCFAVFRP
jgi:hypothetical protein